MPWEMGRLFRKRIKVRQLTFVQEWLLPKTKSSKQEDIPMWEINYANHPLLDQLTDLKMIRQRDSDDPHTMKEFIKTYGPNAGLEAGAETDPAEA